MRYIGPNIALGLLAVVLGVGGSIYVIEQALAISATSGPSIRSTLQADYGADQPAALAPISYQVLDDVLSDIPALPADAAPEVRSLLQNPRTGRISQFARQRMLDPAYRQMLAPILTQPTPTRTP